eukprot:7389942-Prymnesium_polylepis.1
MNRAAGWVGGRGGVEGRSGISATARPDSPAKLRLPRLPGPTRAHHPLPPRADGTHASDVGARGRRHRVLYAVGERASRGRRATGGRRGDASGLGAL